MLGLVASLLPLAACSTPPEQQILTKFFAASRMRDNATLQNFATVSFSPTTEGTIQKFTIVGVGAEERRTLKLREAVEALTKIESDSKEFDKRKKEYQDANREAIQRVLQAEAANKPLKGKDLEVQTAWRKWRDETAEWAKKATDARKAIGPDRTVAEISAFDARSQVDVTKFDGELVTKEVTIDAEVKAPEAQAAATQKLHVIMTKAELKNGPEGKTVDGRWVITHISPVDAPGTK
jgi:hypothetical protein